MSHWTPITPKKHENPTISEFDEIRLDNLNSQEKSNGEFRFIIRDLGNFQIFNLYYFGNLSFGHFKKKNLFFFGFYLIFPLSYSSK